MAERRLHPAPADYGIVEIRNDRGVTRFHVYHDGAEICACASLRHAARMIEHHRKHACQGESGDEAQPLPVGFH